MVEREDESTLASDEDVKSKVPKIEPTIDIELPHDSTRYDDKNDATMAKLKSHFEGITDFAEVRSIKLSGSSYGKQACNWLAENVLQKCENIQLVDFSDMFTSRVRSEIPS